MKTPAITGYYTLVASENYFYNVRLMLIYIEFGQSDCSLNEL